MRYSAMLKKETVLENLTNVPKLVEGLRFEFVLWFLSPHPEDSISKAPTWSNQGILKG